MVINFNGFIFDRFHHLFFFPANISGIPEEGTGLVPVPQSFTCPPPLGDEGGVLRNSKMGGVRDPARSLTNVRGRDEPYKGGRKRRTRRADS